MKIHPFGFLTVFVVVVAVVVVVVVVFLTLTRIIKSVVTGQVPVTLGWRNSPGKTQTKGGTRIYHSRRSSCSRQIKIEREIGSQPKMCEVHTGTCIITLFALGKTKYWHRVQQAVI